MKPLWRKFGLAAVVVIALGIVLSTMAPSPATANKADAPRTALTVLETTPTRADWPQTLTANGTIGAWQEAVVAAQTGGVRIAQIKAEVGDKVSAGQVLAELDSNAINAEVRRLMATLESAKAGLAQAEGNAERARIARQGNAISEQSFNEYVNNERSARANVAATQAQLDAQRIVQSHTRIVAVDEGIITTRTAILGKVVQNGDELFRLIRKGRLEWQAEVDANQLSLARPGQPAHMTLPNGIAVTGKVRLASPSLSTTTGRGVVYVTLADSPVNSAAQAGMFASGTVEVSKASALTIPQSAVVMADGYSYVFELGAESTVSRRAVSLGRRQGDRVEVLTGIREGARLVASGGAFLADGDKVTVASNPTPGAPK